MAGNGRKKEQAKRERLVPGVDAGKSSRVSKAAGGLGSNQAMRMEQRGASANSRSRAGGSSSKRRVSQPPTKKAAASKKGSVAGAPAPAHSRLINQVRDKWDDMQPHEQQRLFGVALFLLGFLLFGALTFWRNTSLLAPLARFFFNVFSWAALPVALGLIAFACAHFVEGWRNIRVIRWSLVLGLLVLMALLLAESQLLFGNTTGGLIGGMLATPLLSWGLGSHVLLLGLLVIVSLLTFQVTLSHLRAAGSFVHRVFLAPRHTSPAAPRPSPFLGQRPRFSRYGNGLLENSASSVPTRRPVRAEDDDFEDEDEESAVIEFEDDFDAEHDPRNDINLHSQQVGKVPKGPRLAKDLNRAEQLPALKGARQLPLPEPAPGDVDELEEMEPLAPNPKRVQQQQPRVIRRAANEVASSPWQQPDSSLLNHPEDAKLHILGDDTTTLAKTIQDTLRSFRVEAEVRPEDISIGPTVIRFGIRPTGKPMMKEDEKGRPIPVKDAAGNIVYEVRTRVSRIMALQNDLALVLESKTIRMEAPVPGRPYVGVEIPNKNSRLVTLREILESKEFQTARNKSRLTVALGKDVAGAVRVGDLAKMPHLLIAGATGSGKCLAYDEPVFLADGHIVKVQELIGQSACVLGVTDTETMQQVPTLATFTENGVRDVFEITLDNGVVLRRTGEHPLWAALLNENQHVGRQADGKAMRRTRAIKNGWVLVENLRVCGTRPNFDGHAILCPLVLTQQGKAEKSDADVILSVADQATSRENAATVWNAWRRARPLPDQKFADCPEGYEWRKVISIRRTTAPTVNIEVHSDNHAFVGYAVEHNSVMINAIISSVITQATPDDVRMLMVDPKMVELSMYNGIPHLLSPVVVDVERVVGLLKIAIAEMERRYRLFSQLGVRNLEGYRKLRIERITRGDETLKNLPAIVIIIDELADLMMAAPEEVEGLICRLAQLARATGIHLVVATQRPSVDVITGLIKANIPTRISFMVSSAVDSRTIIDMGGAERLLGRGDMLYLPADAGKPERIQAAFVADEEAERLVAYWRQQATEHAAQAAAANGEQSQAATPGVEPGWEVSEHVSDEFELEDELLEQAEQVVQEYERASISLLQRRLKIGYSRAARLIDLLEERGVISKAEPGGRSREVLETRSSSSSRYRGGGEGRTLADEAADIMEEERLRQEALKRQVEREQERRASGEIENNN